MTDDPELERRFARLREEEAAGAPGFGALLRRPAPAVSRSRPGRGLVWLAVAALLVIIVGIATRRPGRVPERELLAMASPDWRGPTDFLLVLPDNQALRSVPRLGAVDFDWRIP